MSCCILSDMTFEDIVRKRILSNRKKVDEDRLKTAVAMYQQYADEGHRHKARDKAVRWYGRNGLQAEQEARNQERRQKYQERMQDAQRRRWENNRAMLYKDLLSGRPDVSIAFMRKITIDAIARTEDALLKDYGRLDPLPCRINSKLEKMRREREKEDTLLADPMETLLRSMGY